MPADPFGLLRDLAEGAERLGRGLIGQERIRLAVTGLTRAGKTVFLTSLVANLLAAGRGRRTLPALEEAVGGRLRSCGWCRPASRRRRASTSRRISRSLAADPPAWPAGPRTSPPWRLTLELDRRSACSAACWAAGAGDAGVAGLPRRMAARPADAATRASPEWSAATLARLRRGRRAAAARDFLAFVDALPAERPGRGGAGPARPCALPRRAAGLPGHAGLPLPAAGPGAEPGAARRDAASCGSSRCRTDAGGGARRAAGAAAMPPTSPPSARNFFEPFFRRFDRQAVLVDVLGALHAGQAAFDDTAEALAAIAGALRYGGGWLDWLTGAGVSRVAFVATKADHVPARQRDALSALLGTLVAAPQGRASEAAGRDQRACAGLHPLHRGRCGDARWPPRRRGARRAAGQWAQRQGLSRRDAAAPAGAGLLGTRLLRDAGIPAAAAGRGAAGPAFPISGWMRCWRR